MSKKFLVCFAMIAMLFAVISVANASDICFVDINSDEWAVLPDPGFFVPQGTGSPEEGAPNPNAWTQNALAGAQHQVADAVSGDWSMVGQIYDQMNDEYGLLEQGIFHLFCNNKAPMFYGIVAHSVDQQGKDYYTGVGIFTEKDKYFWSIFDSESGFQAIPQGPFGSSPTATAPAGLKFLDNYMPDLDDNGGYTYSFAFSIRQEDGVIKMYAGSCLLGSVDYGTKTDLVGLFVVGNGEEPYSGIFHHVGYTPAAASSYLETVTVTFVSPYDYSSVVGTADVEMGSPFGQSVGDIDLFGRWTYWAGEFGLSQPSGTHVDYVWAVVGEDNKLTGDYYIHADYENQASGYTGATMFTEDVTLTLVLLQEKDNPVTVNLGFIGYYVYDGQVMSTSIHWQNLEEGDMIDWDAVDVAYDAWVAKGGLEPDRTLWKTSGYATFTFEDYAAIGFGDFNLGQLESYYLAYYVDPGYILDEEPVLGAPSDDGLPFDVGIFKPQNGPDNYVYAFDGENEVYLGTIRVNARTKFEYDGYTFWIVLNNRGQGNNTCIYDFSVEIETAPAEPFAGNDEGYGVIESVDSASHANVLRYQTLLSWLRDFLTGLSK